MSSSRRLPLIAILFLLSSGLASAQSGNETQAARQENSADDALPDAFACPSPERSGVVLLRIVIDTRGKVSEAKGLDGPGRLIPLAEECARTWKYAKHPSAPVTKTVALSYESRDCPAAESQRGDLQFSWGLRNRANFVVAYVEGAEPPPPPYPEEERKAGAVGNMILSVSLNADGTVKDVHVIRSLSPGLDKAAMDRLRPMKFKALDGLSAMQLQDLLFQITFRATCPQQVVRNME